MESTLHISSQTMGWTRWLGSVATIPELKAEALSTLFPEVDDGQYGKIFWICVTYLERMNEARLELDGADLRALRRMP